MIKRIIAAAIFTLLIAGCANKTRPEQLGGEARLLAAQQALDTQLLAALQQSVALWQQAPCNEALWRQAYLAWMPWQASILAANSSVELQFWPDKRDLVRQRLSPLPSANWSQLAAPARGFSAAEYLLVQTNPQACQALALAVKDINQQVSAMSQAVDLLHIEQAQIVNTAPQLYWQEQLSALNAQLARVNKKLSLPMNELGNAKPQFAESWRIDVSMALLAASLDAMQARWLAQMDRYTSITNAGLAERISLQFEQVQLALPKQSSLATELTNNYGGLLQLQFELSQLEQMLGVALPQAYGIVSGFNATDGD